MDTETNKRMCDLIGREAFAIMGKMLTQEKLDEWPENDSADSYLMEIKMLRQRLLQSFFFNSFPAIVDYRAELKDFIRPPAFQVNTSSIVFERFEKIIEQKKGVEFGFFFLPYELRTDNVITEMRKRNLRPANLQELLYFSRKYVRLLKFFELSSPSANYQIRDYVFFARTKYGSPFTEGGKPYVEVGAFSHYREPKEKIIWYPDVQVILGVYRSVA